MRKTYEVVYEGKTVTVDENEQRPGVWLKLVEAMEEHLFTSVKTLEGRIDDVRKKAIKRQSGVNAWHSTVFDLRETYFPQVPLDEVNSIFHKHMAEEQLLEGSRPLDNFFI